MKEKVEKYFETEYNQTAGYLRNHECGIIEKSEIVWYALQRCLGVAQFTQDLGVPYEFLEPLYYAYREKLQELIDK